MGMGNAPVIILREGTKREKGKDAQFNNISAARAISDAVRSSLGPRGMDKMLVDSVGDVVITNDGVTILKEMDVQHPAAKRRAPQEGHRPDRRQRPPHHHRQRVQARQRQGPGGPQEHLQEGLHRRQRHAEAHRPDRHDLQAGQQLEGVLRRHGRRRRQDRRRQGQGRKVHRRPEEHPDRQEGRRTPTSCPSSSPRRRGC